MSELIVTIDGPAGSGKTTVAKKVARLLNFSLLESGSFYRALSYVLLQKGITKITTDELVKNIIKDILLNIEHTLSPEGTTLFYKKKPLREELRSKEVEEVVSEFSAHPFIREEVTNLLREVVKGKKIISEGRDMGSFVFPEADVKFYFTADLIERAHRRHRDFPHRSLEEIMNNLSIRDKKDSERGYAPLVIPRDAIIIDTTKLNIEEVVEKVISVIKKKLCQKKNF